MTDKQIIIDEMLEEIGFDVQQCGYLEIIEDAPNYPEIGGTYTAFECNLYCRDCKFINDCRYKQLLRKEQECEELKGKLNCCFCNPYVELNDIEKQRKCIEITECFRQQLDQLKAENDKLKEELNQKYVRNDIKEYCPFFFRDTATCLGRDLNEIGQLKFCRQYHNCWIKKISKENVQYKQTLAEIKEIAENNKHSVLCFTAFEGDAIEVNNEPMAAILQKISECEVENER